ncbi:MAG TPA: hypothetical protein VIT38_02840 [Allosphingosinicella sp.]|jgi:opacity protein-like surface antigen
MNRIYFAAAAAMLAGAPVQAAQQQPAPTAGVPHTVHGELILYQDTNYNGDDWTVEGAKSTVHTDWNIRSVAVHPGDRWQICARSRYRDPCIILDRNVPDAAMIGIDTQIGSARPAPEPAVASAAPN